MIKHVTQESFDRDVVQAPGKVLIDFYATWCGPCKAMAPVLDEVASELPSDRAILKIDIDAEPALARKYAVMSVPTLMVLEGGREVARAVGMRPKDAVKELLA